MNTDSANETEMVNEPPRRRGRTPKATPDRISEAVKALEAQGKEPTVEAVQALTGGSDGTVCRLLRELKESRTPTASAMALPDALVKSLKAYAEASVADVSEKWRERFNELRASCIKLEMSTTQLEKENEELQREAEHIGSERDQQAGRCTLLREELNTQKQEIAALRNQLVVAELHAGRADDERHTAIDRLQREEVALVKANEQLDQNSEVVTSMLVELATTKAHLEHAQQRIKELQTSSVQHPIRAMEASTLEQRIKAVKAIRRTGIDTAPINDDDDDVGPL